MAHLTPFSKSTDALKSSYPLLQSGLVLVGFIVGALTVVIIEAYIGLSLPSSQSKEVLSEAKKCEQQGGYYDEKTQQCELITSDRGVTCSSNDDCSGWCLPEDTVEVGKPTSGTCSEAFSPQGCFKFVDNGKVNSICMPE